jgi:hypothetical protein
MWITVQRLDTYHVLPINDLKDHYDHARCWCHPEVKDEGALIVHYSIDGREFYEAEVKLKGH